MEVTEKAAENAADDAAETIIELVEHIPFAYLVAAFVLGGAVAVMVMLAISKPPVDNAGE